MTKEGTKGGVQFYNKVKKEYQNSAKPFIYEFSLNSEQPKPKKFRLLLGKFIEIFRENMLDQYRYDTDQTSNYWDELEKNFSNTLQMSFIMRKIYQGRDIKMRIYFVLLLHTKKLFNFFETLFDKMGYLFKNIKEKRAKYQKDIALLSFFKDGQYVIQSQFITDFNHFREEEEEKKIMMKKDVKLLLEEIVEQVERNYKIYMEQRERERVRKEKEEQIKKAESNKKKEQKPKLQPQAKALKQPVKPVVKNEPTPVQPTSYQNIFSTPIGDQLQLIRQRPRHIKNSQYLYKDKFKQQCQIFKFNEKPEVSENKLKCYQCQQPLSNGFYIFGTNINYCNYTGEWFCNEHTAQQRIQIPYKAIEDFDLKGYNVSKRAYEQIKSYFDKAIILIKFDDDVVKKNKKFNDFLILKRQIHLMYDSICNCELMDKLFGPRINYCLKQNLFSLKNLYDVYNGHQAPHLENEYGILVKHFYKCEICQSKKGRICGECRHPPKIFSFQLRDTFSCKHCQKIFHRRCLTNNRCGCQNL